MAVGRAISGHTKLAIECSLVLAGVARQRPDPVTDLHGAACARSSFSGRASVDIWDTIDPVATYDFDPNVCRIRWQAYDYQVDGSIMEHQRHGTPHHMVVPLLLVT
ncbi:hypothetical protein [Demequina lutea]|nr:hypothetical protein [Demequina lutea]